MSAWSRVSVPQDIPQTRNLIIPQKSVESDDIPTLPDAEDLPEISKETASKISKIALDQSTMYQELDSELLKQHASVALDGINLTPLLKFIHPDVNIKESDTIWSIDSLFKDLAEYYQNEDISS